MERLRGGTSIAACSVGSCSAGQDDCLFPCTGSRHVRFDQEVDLADLVSIV